MLGRRGRHRLAMPSPGDTISGEDHDAGLNLGQIRLGEELKVAVDLACVYLLLFLCLIYAGYGITKLLLPVSLGKWRFLVAPFAGYAVIVILLRSLNTHVLTGEQSVAVTLVAVTGLNAFAFARVRRPSPSGLWKESLAPVILSLLVYVVAVVPLLSYGFLTAVGTNGDVEQYLASAEYARQLTVSDFGAASPNPMRDVALAAARPSMGGEGFSHVLLLVATLLRWPALHAFAPTSAFFVAANAVATFLFARQALGLSLRASAIAGSLLGLNSLILWACLFNFGRQVAALPLLPVAALAFDASVKCTSWRSVLFASLLFAAAVVTYLPASLLLLLSMGIFVTFTVVTQRRLPRGVKAAGAVVALGVLPLATDLPRIARSFEHLLDNNIVNGTPVSSNPLPSDYLPVGHVYGLSYYTWPEPEPSVVRLGQVLGNAAGPAEVLLVVLFLSLGAIGLWHTLATRRLLPSSLAIACTVFLLVMRFALHDRYSYFKSVTFTAFVGPPASGYSALFSSGRQRAGLGGGRGACSARVPHRCLSQP